jgi:hypothetical protein
MPLREQFDALSLSDIEEFVKEGREEDLHLDFKLVTDSELKKRDDRRTFAVSASGFANSDGGLIIWGIDARRNADGIDCAVEAPGVNGLKKLLSKLIEYTGSVINPTLVGIDHRAIPSDYDADHGFVVTLVPVSDSGPHMAKLGENRYYKRSGGSFVVMEHFEIADMFGRRPQPHLSLSYGIRGVKRIGPQSQLEIELSLQNGGRGSARAPYLAIWPRFPYGLYHFGIDGNGHQGLPELVNSRDGAIRFGGSADIFIHPDVTYPVAAISAVFGADSNPPDLNMNYEFCADGVALVKGQLVLSRSQLVTAA